MAPDLLTPSVVAPAGAGAFQTLYADPPWLERGGGQIKRGADRHYDLMSTREICLLPVCDWVAPSAHLYLWVTNNFLLDGFGVMGAWGFRYVTTVTWVKDRPGLGQYYRGMTEHLLFGVRGPSLPYRLENGVRRQQGKTVVYEPEAPPITAELPSAIEAPRTQHSVKPEVFRKVIERVSHGPYLELFARRPVEGWTVWGNEV